MSNSNIGDRVLALESADENEVRVYGTGVYVGNQLPDPTWPYGPNPVIMLDSGKKVWGYECWWFTCHNPEEWLREFADGRTISYVD